MKRIWKDASGSLVLETALSLLVIVPCVFSIFEICMLTYTYSTLNDAVRQGVRYAVSHGTDSSTCSGPSSGCSDTTGANVAAIVKNEAKLSGHNMSGLVVTVNYLDGASTPSSRVQITAKYPYSPFVNYAAFQQTLNVSAQGRIVF
jgi:Flp pilus assembly protein TadG